ncbi:MAG: hypothetical protein ACLR5S_05470 [Ruminococcus sp.]
MDSKWQKGSEKLSAKSRGSSFMQLPEPEPLELQPENIPLDIVYEDDDLLVVNKPKGMVVHPAPGHATGTRYMHYCIIAEIDFPASMA